MAGILITEHCLLFRPFGAEIFFFNNMSDHPSAKHTTYPIWHDATRLMVEIEYAGQKPALASPQRMQR